jgi:hypothetical protein
MNHGDLTVQSGEQIDVGELVLDVRDKFVAKVTSKRPPKRTKWL